MLFPLAWEVCRSIISSGHLHYAVSNGVIVCCAAGNIFGANDVLHGVVWPAHYPRSARSRGQ